MVKRLDENQGWTAGVYGPDGEPITVESEAGTVAESFGCSVVWAEDAGNGLWGIDIPIHWVIRLNEDGFVEEKNEHGAISIDVP